MLTRFGKFCRKIRIDNGKLLFDMAQQLGVSSAFLSKVETGKAKPPIAWKDIIAELYCLSEQEKKELALSLEEARNKDVISLKDLSSDDKDMMLAFARKLDNMSELDRNKLKRLLNN